MATIVAALLRSGEQLLLCHRTPDRANYPNVWDLPGGHVEEGETPARALSRELAEELGIDVQVREDQHWTTLRAEGIELEIFVVDEWTGVPQNLAPDEHDDIRWVTSGEVSLLELAHPSYLETLRRALA